MLSAAIVRSGFMQGCTHLSILQFPAPRKQLSPSFLLEHSPVSSTVSKNMIPAYVCAYYYTPHGPGFTHFPLLQIPFPQMHAQHRVKHAVPSLLSEQSSGFLEIGVVVTIVSTMKLSFSVSFRSWGFIFPSL